MTETFAQARHPWDRPAHPVPVICPQAGRLWGWDRHQAAEPGAWADMERHVPDRPVAMQGPQGGPWTAVIRLNGRPMRLTVAVDPSVAICGATDGPVICRCLTGHDGPHIAFEDTPQAAMVGLHLARLESLR